MKIIVLTLFIALAFLNTTAQQQIVPIIDMKIGGLLGGVQNGKFVDARTTVESISGETDFSLFFANGQSETVRLPKPFPNQDVCEQFHGFSLGEERAEEFERMMEKGGVGIGPGLNWTVQPREIKQIDLKNAAYQKVVADYLKTKGLARPRVELKQVMRVDLEGDGQEEVLIAASRVIPYDERKENALYDEYSVLLMRKIVNGRVRTLVLGSEVYPRNKYGYDGNIFSLSSILDLNGDGKMELVVYSAYYEGNATEVIEMIGNKPTPVKTLMAECGV